MFNRKQDLASKYLKIDDFDGFFGYFDKIPIFVELNRDFRGLLVIEAHFMHSQKGIRMRVNDPADPRRCKAACPDGQCQNVAAHGSEFCEHHGGLDHLPVEMKRGFLLAKAEERNRLVALSDDLEPVKELRDAISLQHMLIEKRYNAIKDDADMIQSCGPLNQMLQTMERLVSSCHRIETNLGELLARNAVLALAKEMVEIVISELEGIEDYEAIIDRITERLVETIRKANNIPTGENQALPPPR